PLSEKERPKGNRPPTAQPQGSYWCRYHQAPVQPGRQGDSGPDHGEHVHAVFSGLQFLLNLVKLAGAALLCPGFSAWKGPEKQVMLLFKAMVSIFRFISVR